LLKNFGLSVKSFLTIIGLLVFCYSCHAQEMYRLEDIQGAWWSDKTSPTADFAITGLEVWLDYDSAYHPCTITTDNVLVFDLGSDGRVEHRIVRVDARTLVLENLESHEVQTYTKDEQAE
jgi:hypothetical protein